MSPDLIRFLLFTGAGLGALALGYAGRRRGWLDEAHSRRIHFHTVTWAWSGAALVALWRLPLTWSSAWIVLIEIAVIILPALAIIPLARRICATREQVGVMAIAAGVGNIGWTLGGYLCFILVKPAGEALAVAGTAAAILAIVNVLAMYPIAHHHGTLTPGVSLKRLMARSLFMLPALPLYLGLVGVTLSATVPFPHQLIDWYLVDIVLLAVTAGGYLGVGLRMRLGGGLAWMRQHLLLAVFTFGVTPALTAALILAAGLTAAPMTPTATRVMLIEGFMPAGISCVMLANIFHLDTRLGASLWLWNTLAFLVVVLPVLLLVMAVG